MSSFALTLDTRAPSVSLTGRTLQQDDYLAATLTPDESASISAWALIPGQPPISGQVTGTQVVFDLNGTHWPQSGQIQVSAVDSVGNASTSLFDWFTPPWFSLTLDTTAPILSVTDQQVRQGDAVELSYVLNEGMVLSASAVVDGRSLTGSVSGGVITFDITGETWSTGRVSIDVIDAVGNLATREIVISTSTVQVDRGWRRADPVDFNDYVRYGWVPKR